MADTHTHTHTDTKAPHKHAHTHTHTHTDTFFFSPPAIKSRTAGTAAITEGRRTIKSDSNTLLSFVRHSSDPEEKNVFSGYTFLSFFLGFRRPNLITGLSGWRAPD